MKRKLFVLANSVWHADDFLNNRNCNPIRTDLYLYDSEEKANEGAHSLVTDSDIYNDGTLYQATLDEVQLLELSGFETIEDFDDAMSGLYEYYGNQGGRRGYADDKLESIAQFIVDNNDNEWPVDCANYDFDKSIEGAIIVVWSWEKYVGYARKCHEIRGAYYGETEQMLTKRDETFVEQVDVVMTKEEVEACDDLQSELTNRLIANWKWTNPFFVLNEISKF